MNRMLPDSEKKFGSAAWLPAMNGLPELMNVSAPLYVWSPDVYALLIKVTGPSTVSWLNVTPDVTHSDPPVDITRPEPNALLLASVSAYPPRSIAPLNAVLLPLTVSMPLPRCCSVPVPAISFARVKALLELKVIVPLLVIWLPVTPTWSLS